MYFGDHPYADLADVTLHHGWHTGAVIRELEVRSSDMMMMISDMMIRTLTLVMNDNPN